jgi:CRISPR system Cascade subunit CasA
MSGCANESCQFMATVLVRGQGKSEGFHHIALPIPSAAMRGFGPGPERDSLAARSKSALNDNSVMQNRVLKPAVLSLLEGGPKDLNFDKREVNAWWDSTQKDFAAAWSPEFFPWLWRTLDNPDKDAARLEWLNLLRTKAEAAFQSAIARYPYRSGRRYRAIVRAESFLHGSMCKQFQEVEQEENNSEHAHTD